MEISMVNLPCGTNWPHQLATETMIHGGVPSLLHSVYRPKTMCKLVDYTGGIKAYFWRYLKWNRRQGEKMVICFTLIIWHVRDRLHSSLLPPRRWPPRPMGPNLGTYNIWGDSGFLITQAIQASKQGNYDLMILVEKRIPDKVYCRNHMGYYLPPIFPPCIIVSVAS